MAIKTLLDTQNQPTTAKEAMQAAEIDLYELKQDIEVIAWGCDLLWHSQFLKSDDNEYLSLFPVAVLRSLASRTSQLHTAVYDLVKGDL